jgi:peroxiredoxin (alkyl hydroperoxide reductase subunit C)
MLQIGKVAPNFLASGIYKNLFGEIQLSDYQGKKYVLLIFYPANFTPVSTIELIKLNERIEEFKQLSTQILAISVDSPFSHLHYLASDQDQGGVGELNYPLVSDLSQTITKTYNLHTNEGLAFPGTFIVDKEGIIQYHTVNNLLCCRNIDELLRVLKSIQYIEKNPGQACPVDWKNDEPIFYTPPLESTIDPETPYSNKL